MRLLPVNGTLIPHGCSLFTVLSSVAAAPSFRCPRRGRLARLSRCALTFPARCLNSVLSIVSAAHAFRRPPVTRLLVFNGALNWSGSLPSLGALRFAGSLRFNGALKLSGCSLPSVPSQDSARSFYPVPSITSARLALTVRSQMSARLLRCPRSQRLALVGALSSSGCSTLTVPSYRSAAPRLRCSHN